MTGKRLLGSNGLPGTTTFPFASGMTRLLACWGDGDCLGCDVDDDDGPVFFSDANGFVFFDEVP